MDDWRKQSASAKVDAIMKVYRPGFSTAATIARTISELFDSAVTRNAIIGVYSRSTTLRLDCPLNGSNNGSRGSSARSSDPALNAEMMARRKKAYEDRQRREVEEAERQREARLRDETRSRIANSKISIAEWEKSNSKYIALEALTDATCRWPIGERDFLFCGHSTAGVDNTVYCGFHRALAYDKPSSDGRRYDRERTAKLSLQNLSKDS